MEIIHPAVLAVVTALVAATSTASEMAIPRLPGLDGSAASIALPAAVASDGDGCTVAPHVSIISRRYGFWSKDARTCHTSQLRPKKGRIPLFLQHQCILP